MSDPLNQAVHRLLRPLVRYLIGQGVTFTSLMNLLKVVYVEEAMVGPKGRLPTDSDLSLATGIHRKEVKRLRTGIARNEGAAEGATRGAHIAAQLIGAWVASDDTREADGRLKDLPLHSATELSFETLTRRIKADMRPRAILDDLIRARAVTVDDGGRVHLLRTAYVPDVPHDKLAFLADNVGDHMASAFHNLGTDPPFVERALFFDALPYSAVQGARPRIEAAADHLLQGLHRELTPHEAGAQMDPRARRVRIGVYYYEEPKTPADDSHDTTP